MQNDETGSPQDLYALRRPNWNDWKHLKTIKLWHAVALACDLDPYQFTIFDSPKLCRTFNPLPGKFDGLLSIAKANLGGASILKPRAICPDEIDETDLSPANFGAWAKLINYPLPEEFPWQDGAVMPLSREWPWGTYETDLLRHLAKAASRFWTNYDATDSSTAPTNRMVAKWLIEQGVADRNAEIMAKILRADGLSPGPRK
jgi:hypothetical protein